MTMIKNIFPLCFLLFVQSQDTNDIQFLGETLVTLNHKNCPTRECILGNFVTDAMVHYYASITPEGYWTKAALAIVPPELFNFTINRGSFTYDDIDKVLPVNFEIYIAEISGKELKNIFESNNNNNNILQVSGIKIVYNFHKKVGERVETIKVRCRNCAIPTYEVLNENESYGVILPTVLRDLARLKGVRIDYDGRNIIIDYIKLRSPIFVEESDRIVINETNGAIRQFVCSSQLLFLITLFVISNVI